MKTFVIIGNNVIQDTFIKAGLYTFNATIKSHQSTHRIGFKGASGWVDVELPTNPNKFTKAHAIFELKEDVTQISLCRFGASTTNPIIVQTPMWTEGNNISTPSPNPDDLDETTSNVDIKLSTQILQTNEKIQLIATEEQFNELGQGGVTAFGMIKVMAGDIELKVGKDGVISSINQSAEEIQINADRIRFTGSVEFENAVKNISPDAIIIEVGIPYYEFKKAEGSPYAEYEELNIPVYANIGDNREFLNVGAITSNTNITGLSIQQVEANKVRITAQSNLGASAGTAILRVEVRGKIYLADFNFKVIEKPKDGISPVIYRLQPSVPFLKMDEDGYHSKSSISCRLMITNENGTSYTTTMPAGYQAQRLIDGDRPYNYALGSEINTTLITDNIEFRLVKLPDPNNQYYVNVDQQLVFVLQDGKIGEDGKGITFKGSVPNYASLSGLTGLQPGDGFFNEEDGMVYVWDGTKFPAEGNGFQFRGPEGRPGLDGKSPYIGFNGNWWVWDGTKYVDSGDTAKGDDGKSPEIRNGYWWAWDGTKWYNTGVKAKGDDGKSPYIGENGNWYVWDSAQGKYVDSGDKAKGDDGKSPEIRNGYWWAWDGEKWYNTEIKAKGDDGKSPYIGENGNWYVWDSVQGKYVDSGDAAHGDDGKSPEIRDGYWWVYENGQWSDTGIKAEGVDGKGISIKGSVDNYNQLLGLTGLSAGDAYLNKSDGKLYIWDGFNFPPNGQGILFQGEAGISVQSLIQQYINHDSKTVQPSQNADWLDVMPKYEDGLYMWSRFKMTLSNGQVQYSSYSLLEDFEAMMDSARIKNLIIYGDFAGEMKEIKSSNPVNYYPIGWRVSGLSHDSNGVPSDQNNIAPKIIKINTGLPKGMLAGLRITPKTNLQGIYQNLSSNLVLNEVHTAYVFARKRNASSTAQIRLKYGSIAITENLTTTWARYVLKFTPTSQRPFEILFNKTGAWTANDEVEISKIQLAQTELIFDYRPFSYVENAFAGSTSIDGGVVATNMVILNNEGGEIRSYVSGIDANPYAFAAGVSGFGTDLEKRNIGIKHDGTLIAKNADIEGEVSATGGKVGGFSLEDMGLLSQNNRFFIDALNGAVYLLDENGEVKTSFIPNDLPSTPEAFFAGSGGGSLSLTALQGVYDDGQVKTTGTFPIDVSGGKQFSLLIPQIRGSVNTDYTKLAGGMDGSSGTTIYFELMRGSKVHLDLGRAIVFSTGGLMTETFTIQQRTIQISSSGVYSLRARVETNVTPSNHSATGGASVSIISPSAEFIAVVNRSQIGNNGMIIASSTTRYDFMVGDKHIVRRGNYGFRITENGLQKSNNMNASMPTWRNIEQPF